MRSNAYVLLSKVFSQAVRDDLISSSPLIRSGIKRPSKRRHEEVEPLAIAEIEALAESASLERNRLAILVAGLCGLRGGEIGGLRVRDLDKKRCRLAVSQAVVRDRTGKRIGPPKTENSRRTISIPSSLSAELAKFVRGKAPEELVFRTAAGGLVSHTELHKWVQAASGGRVFPHQLRHSCASILIENGASPRRVAEYLGNSAEVVMRIYSHLFDAAGTSLADAIESGREDYRQGIGRPPLLVG